MGLEGSEELRLLWTMGGEWGIMLLLTMVMVWVVWVTMLSLKNQADVYEFYM